MTDREKLIEMLDSCDRCNAEYCNQCEFGEDIDGCVLRQKEIIADTLIANGATFAKDTDVPSKWIRVEDRLPTENDADEDLCVLAIHKATPRRYFHWRSVADSPFDFTHWMPLPEPPRVQGVPNGTDHV